MTETLDNKQLTSAFTPKFRILKIKKWGVKNIATEIRFSQINAKQRLCGLSAVASISPHADKNSNVIGVTVIRSYTITRGCNDKWFVAR